MKLCKICGIEISDNKKYCCRSCYFVDLKKRFTEMNESNKGRTWESLLGEDLAKKRKQESSDRLTKNNPSTNPETAKKISKSLSDYRKKNPLVGEKNPFYGKKHTDEYKKKSSESKKNKWSYDDQQYLRLVKNTPKGDEHPNWNGGTSTHPYPFEFNKVLKENVKKRDDYKCFVCLKETQKLAIHHIDYNKKNIDTCNLISLCYSCHSKTNYNRENWISFFKNMTNCQ